MSRIGKLPIDLPNEVSVDIKGQEVIVKGPKGEEKVVAHDTVKVILKENKIICERINDEPEVRAYHGLTRSLLNNCVIGVSAGFEIILDILGTGYRVSKKGKDLEFSLGFSHSVTVNPIGTNDLSEENQNIVFVRGSNKQAVGEQAARIRKLRKPNPYTGNGIKYRDEIIRRKAGKTAVGGEG
jgi:large subunit ribosomal protein L6